MYDHIKEVKKNKKTKIQPINGKAMIAPMNSK